MPQSMSFPSIHAVIPVVMCYPYTAAAVLSIPTSLESAFSYRIVFNYLAAILSSAKAVVNLMGGVIIFYE